MIGLTRQPRNQVVATMVEEEVRDVAREVVPPELPQESMDR